MRNVHTDFGLNFSDSVVQEFLFDENKDELTFHDNEEPGFVFIEERSNGQEPAHQENIMFQVREIWKLYQEDSSTGTLKVNVIFSQSVSFQIGYKLYLKGDVSQETRDKAVNLFRQYDQNEHGDDIPLWLMNNLPPDITENQFLLESAVKLVKTGDRYEEDVSQRNALLTMYGEDGHSSDTWAYVDIVGRETETVFREWAKVTNSKIRKIGEELETLNQPFESDEVVELKANSSGQYPTVETILDSVTSKIIPSDCGVMKREEHRVLTLANWPEFKIEWARKRVRIGCSTVTIKYPIIRRRTSRLACYVYFSVPKSLPITTVKIVSTCAIRSALGGAVIGVIMANAAAASASFSSMFKRCLETEIIRCVHPGILTLKEPENWK